MATSISSTSSFWCYRCNHFIHARIRPEHAVNCPDCGGGFVEHTGSPINHHHRFPDAAMYTEDGNTQNPNPQQQQRRVSSTRFRLGLRNGDDRPNFNPVIILRGGGGDGGGGGDEASNRSNSSNFELYHDDGAGSGLRSLPDSMSEFLMGSGFDRLLEQLSNLEINSVGRLDHPIPASKAAIESMPVVNIMASHVSTESHCAVCKEQFELHTEAREMPCQHIYHSDCILPWLSIRNSCPVCRHKLPTNVTNSSSTSGVRNSPEEAVGLTIWRLPGGGFAVGTFRGAEREQLPVVFTEMDGGFNTGGGMPRRISWAPSGRRSRESGESGLGRVFRGFVSFLGRIRPRQASIRRSQAWDVVDSRW